MALGNEFHRDVTCGKKEYIVKAISVSIELHKGVCVANLVHAVVSEVQGMIQIYTINNY